MAPGGKARRRVRWGRWTIGLAFGCALALSAPCSPREAWAQPAARGSSEEQRTALFRQASSAGAAGRWTEARDDLRAALQIRSSPKVLFSLAQAEEQLDQLASAQADYLRALADAKASGQGEVIAAAEQAASAIAARVPQVRILVLGARDRAVAVTLDDRTVPVGVAIPVDPGTHRIAVGVPGMQEVATDVAVSEAARLDVPLRLDTAAVATAAPVPPSTTDAASRGEGPEVPRGGGRTAEPGAEATGQGTGAWHVIGLVTAGAGLAGLGIGAAFGIQSISKHDQAQRACPGATCADASGAQLWNEAVSAGDASTVAFVVGGAALAAGALLWLVTLPSKPDHTQVGVGPGWIQLRGAW